MKMTILPFIAEGISTNPKTYKAIDKLYNTDKIKFIKAAKKNAFYDNLISQEGSIEQEYYFKKALGILEVSLEDETVSNEVINILKKSWNYAFNYTYNHENIHFEDFLKKIIRKHKGPDGISDDFLNSNCIMVLFFSTGLQRNIIEDDEAYKLIMNTCITRLEHYKKSNRINLNNASKEQLKLVNSLELKLKKHPKISGNIPSSYRLRLNQYDGVFVKEDTLDEYDKYFPAYEYIFDLDNVSLISIVGNDVLTDKEIKELIYTYSQFRSEDTINEDDFFKYIYPAIQIRYLTKAYKKAKNYFFKNFNEELFEEINKREIENKNIKKTNILLQDENEKLKLKIEQLERDNKRLKLEIEQIENNNKEVNSLREFIFNLNEMGFEEENKIDYEYLKNIKGVMIGGNNALHNKLKEYLHNTSFLGPENLNFDKNIVLNSDVVFVYTNYLSHAMYYKVIALIENQKIIYLKPNVNIGIILKQIIKNVDN